MQLDTSPIVSVVVPTYRRWTRLRSTLAALQAQELPVHEFEVILSDDGSMDGTYEELQQFAASSPMRVQVVSGPNGGPSVARNRGISAAKGEWVAMTDDDCVPAADWLSGHLAFLKAHPEFDGVGGAIIRHGDGLISRYVDRTGAMDHPLLSDGSAKYLVTANALYKRSLLEALGGFSTSYKWPGGEDPDLSERAIQRGARLGVNPGAVVRHMHRETIRGTYRMFWHHGLGAGVKQIMDGTWWPPEWGRTFRHQWLPAAQRAFKSEKFHEAVCFSFMDLVRHLAFRRGFFASRTYMGSQRTSANH